MACLVRLGREAAPGYISLAVSAHPRPPATVISLELLTSPVALGAIPFFTKTLQVYFLLATLHICTTTLPFGSALIPCSPTFSLSSSRRPWTLNTRQFPCLLPALDICYNLLLCEAPSKFILSSPLSTSPPPVCNSTLFTRPSTHNSINHHIVRLRQRRSIVLDRPCIPLRHLLPPLPPST